MRRESAANPLLLTSGLVLFLVLFLANRVGPMQEGGQVELSSVTRELPNETRPPAVLFTTNEDAVKFAFVRFAEEQQEDGSWGPHNDAGQAIEPDTTETTALVLLALASAGQTHHQGKYADQVQRGLDYLLNAGQVDDELIPRRLKLPGQGQTTRSQALATLAIGRLYRLTLDGQWRRALQFAVTELGEAGHWPAESVAHGDEAMIGENIFWQRAAFSELWMTKLPLPHEAITAIVLWHRAQPSAAANAPWLGNHFIGVHSSRHRTREELETQFAKLTELAYESLPVAEQFCAAEALRISNYTDARLPFERLQSIVLKNFAADGTLHDTALQLMILQTRFPKITWSLNGPEDEFPLMSRHEDL